MNRSSILLLVHLSVSLPAAAQFGSASDQVTVSISPISVMQVTGSAVNLNVTSANVVAGQDQMTVTDNATQLLWGTNSLSRKITAQTNLGAPLYTLRVQATSLSIGTSPGTVTLSTTPGDLVVNIGRTSGSCVLTYTALPLASQGVGTDNHSITFTMVAQ